MGVCGCVNCQVLYHATFIKQAKFPSFSVLCNSLYNIVIIYSVKEFTHPTILAKNPLRHH